MDGRNAEVTVDVVLGPEVGPLSDAVVRVRVEDTTHAGAPARVAGEARLAGVSHAGGAQRVLTVRIPVPDVDEKARYTVRAHVAGHDGGDVRKGDYLSMESKTVLTHGRPDRVSVRVRPV